MDSGDDVPMGTDGSDESGAEAGWASESSDGAVPACLTEGEDPQCPAEAPYCVEGTCTGCTGAGEGFCTAVAGACHGPWDRCVGCLEDGDCEAPSACNNAFECGGCTEHDQCPDSACDLAKGECMDAARKFWVSPSTCKETGGFGDEDDPYCTIAPAIGSVKEDGRAVIYLRAGVSPFEEPIEVVNMSRRTIAVLGVDGSPTIANVPYAVDVENESKLYLHNLRLRNCTSAAIQCNFSSSVWLDDVEVDGNADGISAEICDIHLRRSRVFDNAGDAISLANMSSLRMESSVVIGNGSESEHTRAIRSSSSTFDIRYSTITGNIASMVEGDVAPANLTCGAGRGGSIRNSIVLGANLESIDCPLATIDHSVIDTSSIDGEDQVVVTTYDAGWFADVEGFDVHVADPASSPFAGVARWQLGDPRRDLDGTRRTPFPDAIEFAGADQP